MKRKKLAIVSSLVAVLSMTFALTSCDGKKTECEKNGHSFSEVWLNDAESHWHKCDNCEEKSEVSAHVFDNDADTTCNVCGFTRQAHTHTAESFTFDETYHWKDCTVDGCGEQFEKAEHTYGEWEVKDPARDGSDQIDHRLCTVCNREEFKTIEYSRLDFYMFIESAHFISGRGLVVAGTIQRGTISLSDTGTLVEVSGYDGKITVTRIAKGGEPVNSATHGDQVEILLRGVSSGISKGQLLFKADTQESGTSFYSRMTNNSETTYSEGTNQQFDMYVEGNFFSTVTVTFKENGNPGEVVSVDIVFPTKIPLVKFDFSLKTGGTEVFTGRIWELN